VKDELNPFNDQTRTNVTIFTNYSGYEHDESESIKKRRLEHSDWHNGTHAFYTDFSVERNYAFGIPFAMLASVFMLGVPVLLFWLTRNRVSQIEKDRVNEKIAVDDAVAKIQNFGRILLARRRVEMLREKSNEKARSKKLALNGRRQSVAGFIDAKRRNSNSSSSSSSSRGGTNIISTSTPTPTSTLRAKFAKYRDIEVVSFIEKVSERSE